MRSHKLDRHSRRPSWDLEASGTHVRTATIVGCHKWPDEQKEIATLERQGCNAGRWDKLLV